ncbi:TerC/Alx family metal [Candidatus Bealeia paramacronuclearis]|uniref:TerC/Alx family metal n=1 Tax=Candidatus Bealeia paramacronuclearis TaxID=1921001 RepID=A0ABZ2C3L6_9PROT|nr:TerC/Alx family metal [Candidatus Bealeia paramacronuclearis]
MENITTDLTTIFPWAIFFVIIAALIIFDLKGMHRHDHEVSVKESLLLTGFYITFALIFGVWIYIQQGPDPAQDYYVAYLVEKSLSVDNIFVFSLIFQSLHIPKRYQHRVLFYGILGVIFLRGIMLAFGIAIVTQFEWVLYIFGLFLMITGMQTLKSKKSKGSLDGNKFVNWISQKLRLTKKLHGNYFFVKVANETHVGQKIWHATPLFLSLLIIEFADIIFAVDSIPAVLAITQEPYVVYTSNIFAIMGLRALYFAWAAIMPRFAYLKYALGLILVFIGGKIFYAELYGKVPASLSLGVTLILLLGGIGFSVWKTNPSHKKN